MVNYPPPKGKYEALLTVVKILAEDGPLSPKELVKKDAIRAFGYSETDGTTLSPGNSSQAYDELEDVLGVVTSNTDRDLRLTRSSEETDPFLPDASGEGLATLLNSDGAEELRRAEVTAFLLRKLNTYDMSIQGGTIDKAFHEFMKVLWRERDSTTGVYKSGWSPNNLIGSDKLPGGGKWNNNKVKFIRDRAINLGVAEREYMDSGGDNLLPVFSTDVFQIGFYLTYQYFLEQENEASPEFEEFYQEFKSAWYPLPREFYNRHIMTRGLLARGSMISSNSYPILYSKLKEDGEGPEQFKVRHFEAETAWNEDITASEFEIEAV